jgi:tetratricopeptide (TPR) repeat protein
VTSPAPTRFGPYRINAPLAVGGMAELFLAQREEPGGLGPTVALKRLLPHLLGDPSVIRMFLNEARITARIDHPNVVRILEVGDERGQPFIAMELLHGSTFAQLREQAAERGQRVPLPIALRVLIEACRGLDAAHHATDDQGQPLRIVHRDFTPDNIHVGSDGAVKVLDFGIAKSAGTLGGTEPGTLKGKYFYMSPEMISGEPVDHRADVFAAGAMLYEQLCGHRPFTGHTPLQILSKISREAPRRPTELDPSVPLALERICLRALARHPQDRFDSLAQLADALASVAEARPADAAQIAAHLGGELPELPVEAVLAPANREAAKPRRARGGRPRTRRFTARRMVLVLLALAAAGGGFYWTHRPLPAPAKRLAEARRHPEAKGRLSLASLAEDPRATPAQLAEAGALLLAVHADRAALELSEGLERRRPKSVEGYLIEARAAIGLRYGKRAEAALDRAQALAPQDPRPDEARADLRTLQGALSGALEAIEEASRKAPGQQRLVVRRADLLVRLGRLEEAGRITAQALEQGFTPRIAAERAFVTLQLGQRREAVALLKRVLRAEPKLAAAHYYLGAALGQQGDLDGAEREYRAADALDPDDLRAAQALITLLQGAHREPEAAKLKAALDARTAEAE